MLALAGELERGVDRPPTSGPTVATIPSPLYSAEPGGPAFHGTQGGTVLVASSYPLLDAFWTIVEIFFFVLWIWLVVSVFVDVFRSHDLSGAMKAVWVLFVIVFPLIGVLVYLLFRGGDMHERALRAAQSQHNAVQGYFQHLSAASTADELTKLAELRDRGVLTPEEFEQEKAKVLSRSR